MGEYIPSPADLPLHSTNVDWSDSVALLPPSQSRAEQENLLVLAWVLLLYRGTVQSEEGGFAWGSTSVKDAAPITQGGLVSAVAGTDTDILTNALDAIRTMRQESSDVEESLLLLNAAPTAEWTFALEIKLSQNNLYLRQHPRSPSASQPVGRVLPDVFADILTAVIASLNQPIGQAVRIGKRELAAIWKWNQTLPPAIDRCVQDMISENAQRQPHRPAVVSWDGEMTYAELDARSTRLAHRLLDLGLTVGQPVPLCFEKSMWTIVGVLAVLKAGGALVLTDPSQPEGRLRTIATEVNAHIILTSVEQTDLGQRVVPSGHQIVVGPALIAEDMHPLPTASLPVVPMSSPCYIQFTSGSTGKPKGVVISHSNYTSGAVPRAAAVGYNEHSRVLDFPSYAFDVSVDCMLCTLARSGCICVPSEDSRVNDLSGAIRSMNVNMAHMTPSVARVLDADIMPSLEVLGLGGEAITASDAADWGRKTHIIIAYGPSECTVGCTINNDIPLDRPYTSIGLGVGGCSWVVDPADHNRLTPVGAVGELLVEGPIVGDGYLNEPEKTKAVFIEDPEWLVAGGGDAPGRKGRLYKTGDLVRYDPDASSAVVFIGRADQQVKLRGQRVELGEIEHHVRNHLPAGANVAAEVIAPGGKKSDSILVVFVAEQKSEGTGTSCEIVSFSKDFQKVIGGIDEAIGDDLPRYMIPAAYIPLDQMPLLVSLKTDRKQLRALGNSLTRRRLAELKISNVEKTPPTTAMEKKLHALWVQLFGDATDIGVQDHFFSLGGDSLKAMKLVAAAREQGLALRVTDIFRYPALGQLAQTMTEIQTDDNQDIAPFSMLPAGWEPSAAREETAALCGLDASVVEDIYPCTPLQEALMALSAKVADAYTAQRVVELPDTETRSRLRSAFETVSKDCAILRTRIVQVPRRGLMQVVLNTNTPWTDSASLADFLAHDTADIMGLGTSLARLADVHDTTTGKHHIVLSIHHALYDGWSMPLVIDRVNRAYRAESIPSPAPFKSFIHWLGQNDRRANEAYWADQLAGATALQFPVQPYKGYQARADSLLEHYVQLPKTSTGSTTSMATAIRGAWALLASQYTATEDVVLGETLTGRNAPVAAVEGIEGPMITTVPVRVRIDPSASAAEFLEQIHEQMVHRISHEHTGLQHIRRLNSDAREACELRTGIVIHPTVDEEQAVDLARDPATGFMPTSEAEAAREALKFNSYSLMLVFTVDPNGFLVMASFDSKTVDSPQMDRALRHFDRLVQLILADPSQRVQDIVNAAREGDVAEQQRLAAIAPASLPVDGAYVDAAAAWIVDPTDHELLVPAGGVGELLVQRATASDAYPDLVATPSWLEASSMPCYTTNQLAKCTTDGQVIIVRRKDEQTVNRPGAHNRKQPHDQSLVAATPKQQTLQQTWAQVLDIPAAEILLSDDFFDLGGDSIRAMKLVSEARMDGLKLTVTTVFDHRQLFDMAAHAEEIQVATKSTAVPSYTPFSTLDNQPDLTSFLDTAIRPSLSNPSWNITDVYPTRPLQEIAVNATVSLPRFSVRYELFYMNTAVDRRKLFASCAALVARNEILRTVFVTHNSTSYAAVLADHPCPIVEYDIDGTTDLETFSRQVCDVDVQSRIPLGSPFVKFFFVHHAAGNSSLILRISHAQYDEICLPILLQQLSALYEDRPVPQGLPFAPFVAHTLRDAIPASVPYWQDLLRGSAMSMLQPEVPADPTAHFALFKEVSIAARPRDVTVATLPTAAWAMCLARRLGKNDVVFGEVVSGRNTEMPNADAVVGPCWQYVPVRVQFQPQWTGRDLLRFVQRQHLASARFEGMALKEIVEQCTDWPETVDWFDTVVHQDVEHVEDLSFMAASSRMQTVYPHFEPLREIKVQAFPRGDMLGIEIVTVESWKELAGELLEEMLAAVAHLVNRGEEIVGL
ncbi:hypothetical protein FE257_012774 [Aspergillus nanangensis]|uniref:Carrier domain-containing protein n=1 Tax=Aspergillus nanangensis TaxID=2582783 RepID=A0AAD4GRN7_ASPNN|nr:hypothetical protein FE257_012774 [Aspergillus nanangensis]